MELCFSIKGRVQGVGFRYWAIHLAYEIGNISGYIHNSENGDVIVYISGEEKSLNEFQAKCYRGPLFSRVDSIEISPQYKQIFPLIKKGVFQKI